MMGGGGWGAAIGAGINQLTSAAEGAANFAQSAYFNRKARSDWRKSLQRGPTYFKEGLLRAGINPIYVFGKGGGVSSAATFQQQAAQQHLGGSRPMEGASIGSMLRANAERAHHAAFTEMYNSSAAQERSLLMKAERERVQELWRLDKRILKEDGAGIRELKMKREALMGGGNPVTSATGLINSLR